MDINTKKLKKNAFRIPHTCSRRPPGREVSRKDSGNSRNLRGRDCAHHQPSGFEIPGIPFDKMPEVNAALQPLIDGLDPQ